LLATTFAKQFHFGARQDTQVGHPGTGLPITVDRANPYAAVAAGLGQRHTRLACGVAASSPPPAKVQEFTQQHTGRIISLLVGHGQDAGRQEKSVRPSRFWLKLFSEKTKPASNVYVN